MRPQALIDELEHISILVKKRMDGLGAIITYASPEFSRWATECQLSRFHDLKMALPSTGRLRAEAKAWLKKRLAERSLRRIARTDTQIMISA